MPKKPTETEVKREFIGKCPFCHLIEPGKKSGLEEVTIEIPLSDGSMLGNFIAGTKKETRYECSLGDKGCIIPRLYALAMAAKRNSFPIRYDKED